MFWRWRLPGLIVLLLAAVPVVGSAGDSYGDLEHNGQLLRKWKEDPEHYARLQRDLKAFYAMPPERQEQLRRFDRDLHAGDAYTQRHLWEVLVRYNTWLDRLSQADRKRIEEAGNQGERLRVIHEMREKQWLAFLPQETSKQLGNALKDNPKQRSAILLEYINKEKQRRNHWRETFRHRPPGKDKDKDKGGKSSLPE
jgi:hypothetical protein